MKKFIFIFLFIVSASLNAQTFSVGDTSCNYVKVDTVLRCYQIPFGAWNMTKSYSVDLDADMIDDISLINAHNGSSPGSSSHQHGVFTCTSTTGVEFVYNSSATSCWTGAMNLASNLTSGSPLTASLNWGIATNRNVFDFDKLFWFSGSYYCGHVTQFGGTTVNIGFRKILTGDTIYGWIKLNTTINGNDKIVSYAYKHTASNNTVTPVFTNTNTNSCAGTSFSLSANPPGGSFYGNGVSGSVFTSSLSSIGNFTVYYSNGCTNNASLSINVLPLPNPAFTNSTSIICNGDSLTLNASPSGGVFGGLGVVGNVFHANITGSGIVPVNYFYTDANGCSNTASSNVSVVTPTINIASSSNLSCPGESVTLTATGANTYSWSNGATTPTCSINPSVSSFYFALGTTTLGCKSMALFYQNVGAPIVSASSNYSTICIGGTAYLSASGASSYTWSTGSSSSISVVSPTVTTTYTVIGVASGGCSDTAYVTVNVTPLQVLNVISSNSLICAGDTVTINVSGSNGFIIEGGQIWISTSLSSVVLSLTSTTTFTVTGGCSLIGYYTQNVSACVGINELSGQENYFTIFPNPNSGEFEIKGIKEETIFISNELGQLISTKILSKENNYAAKLNDLQSGVYFVGNKFYRQKVVVIK